jgi:hypothetical protein
MESPIVGLKILPFALFHQVRELLCLAILRDSLRIPRQTRVVFALVTLNCLGFFGHFASLQINTYDMVV